jgi:hypothetical protein
MHRGSCLCEAIRYEIEDGPKAVVHCHCRFCRKAHGAPYTTLWFMPFSRLRVTEGEEHLARYHLPRLAADRCFCATCGTRLYNHAPSRGMISLIVATLDADDDLRPVAHVNIESKSASLRISDELPQFPAMPGQAEFVKLLSG